MTARPWDEGLLDDDQADDVFVAAEDPTWDDATELVWDEHLGEETAA